VANSVKVMVVSELCAIALPAENIAARNKKLHQHTSESCLLLFAYFSWSIMKNWWETR